MEKRRRAEVLCTIAVVLGLHLSIVWMLLTTSRLARTPNLPPSNNENNAIHPPPDWAAELSRAARDAVSNESPQNTRDFGFPHSPAAKPDKAGQFGWDYTATHRVESLPEGGLLVHINENCVFVLFPLPFVGCGIGKKKANGELFDHMRDP
jgi:hypothetical protein